LDNVHDIYEDEDHEAG